uniref:AMP-binding enzyme C-terminal domain-containing protein n=1 Tax=Musca domestica TaxID=7370 RepID=A0A1I8NKN8_MUSDO
MCRSNLWASCKRLCPNVQYVLCLPLRRRVASPLILVVGTTILWGNCSPISNWGPVKLVKFWYTYHTLGQVIMVTPRRHLACLTHRGGNLYIEGGNLYIVDRKKDILKYKGFHYWPDEIESTIRELTDVVDSCVVGIFNERYGDVAGALVLKKSGSELSVQQIVEHVRNRLDEPQKQLHNGVYFVEKLPQNVNGKILKREAKELLKSFVEKMSSRLDR